MRLVRYLLFTLLLWFYSVSVAFGADGSTRTLGRKPLARAVKALRETDAAAPGVT